MTRMDKIPKLLPPHPAQGGRRRRRLARRTDRPRHPAGDQHRVRARGAPAAGPGPALLLHRRQRRRLGVGVLRQDGHGPGPLRLDRPDRGGGARRAVRARHRPYGRHAHQREPGRRLRLDGHPVRRQADARGGRRGAPRAGRDGGREARAAGRSARRHRWRRARQGGRGQEGLLCGADRRALFQRPARVEQADRQRALRTRQGAAEEAERIQGRRQADQARRHRAESVLPGAVRHRHQGRRHAACPRDPPAGRGRDAR